MKEIHIPEEIKHALRIVAVAVVVSGGGYLMNEVGEKRIDDMCGGSTRSGCDVLDVDTCRNSGGPWGGSVDCGKEKRYVPKATMQDNPLGEHP